MEQHYCPICGAFMVVPLQHPVHISRGVRVLCPACGTCEVTDLAIHAIPRGDARGRAIVSHTIRRMLRTDGQGARAYSRVGESI
jgi:hypothetical protein